MEIMDAKAFRRFASKFDYDEITGCWIWTGALAGGRPSIYYGMGGMSAAQLSYEHFVLKARLVRRRYFVLEHAICENRLCVNPYHLDYVHQSKNIQRHHRTGQFKGVE